MVFKIKHITRILQFKIGLFHRTQIFKIRIVLQVMSKEGVAWMEKGRGG